jgi:hypothetical protein
LQFDKAHPPEIGGRQTQQTKPRLHHPPPGKGAEDAPSAVGSSPSSPTSATPKAACSRSTTIPSQPGTLVGNGNFTVRFRFSGNDCRNKTLTAVNFRVAPESNSNDWDSADHAVRYGMR